LSSFAIAKVSLNAAAALTVAVTVLTAKANLAAVGLLLKFLENIYIPYRGLLLG